MIKDSPAAGVIKGFSLSLMRMRTMASLGTTTIETLPREKGSSHNPSLSRWRKMGAMERPQTMYSTWPKVFV